MKDVVAQEEFSLLDSVSDAVIAVDLDTRVVSWNAAATKIYGWTEAEAVGRLVGDLLQTEFIGAGRTRAMEALNRLGHWREEVIQTSRSGQRLAISASVTLMRNAEGEPSGIVAVNRDITRLRELERSMLESSKLAALGEAAAGIAHDVSNWLSTVMLLSTVASRKIEEESPAQHELRGIRDAVKRSAALLDRLASFGWRRSTEPVTTDWCQVVDASIYLLDRLAGPMIELEFECIDGPMCVSADRDSLDQIVLNLLVNARDAMPDGGKVQIELSASTVTGAAAEDLELEAGTYARLVVHDEGVGMTEEVRQRIFEPYFTTKAEGKGTGLGLATIREIVRRHHGRIDVESTPGEGTSFTVLLPAAD